MEQKTYEPPKLTRIRRPSTDLILQCGPALFAHVRAWLAEIASLPTYALCFHENDCTDRDCKGCLRRDGRVVPAVVKMKGALKKPAGRAR
jgi:hypothetical protein